MPKDTFFKLTEEKKQKIVEAGKNEFSRVSIDEASIRNIAQNAGIARGSFYQYFESKKDLLYYILEENKETIDKNINKIIQDSKGNIFSVYIGIYDDITEKFFNDMNQDIYKRIFENMKTDDESLFEVMDNEKEERFDKIRLLIDKERFNLKEENDKDLIIQILNAVTMSSIVRSLKYDSKEDARLEFLRKIEMIKTGIFFSQKGPSLLAEERNTKC